MRRAEIGVRMAMGAQRGQVVWMILKDGLLVTATGVMIGIPLSMAPGRVLASTLYGVMPLDEATYLLAFIGVSGRRVGGEGCACGPRGER
jgi:ABC-type antimicrobial peptide transport system permease subunit